MTVICNKVSNKLRLRALDQKHLSVLISCVKLCTFISTFVWSGNWHVYKNTEFPLTFSPSALLYTARHLTTSWWNRGVCVLVYSHHTTDFRHRCAILNYCILDVRLNLEGVESGQVCSASYKLLFLWSLFARVYSLTGQSKKLMK